MYRPSEKRGWKEEPLRQYLGLDYSPPSPPPLLHFAYSLFYLTFFYLYSVVFCTDAKGRKEDFLKKDWKTEG
jgi:hypothetical protein